MPEEERQLKKKKRGKRIRTAVIIIVCLLIAADLIAANFLVNACLVPDFMRKLDSFERITEESYEKMIVTTDITENRKMLVFQAEQWLENNEGETVTIRIEGDYTLVAKEFKQPEPSHKWALVLHGYTGWKEEMYPFAAWYYRQGFNVLVPDLRCQGESEGDFIGMGYTDGYDCLLWIFQILEQDPEAQIVIHGQSMGAATALIMTGREIPENVKAVVADSSYATAYDMFAEKMKEWFSLPAFPLVDSACLMLRLRGGYDLKKASPIDAVKNSSTPTLFIHGTNDEMISVQNTLDLYDAASCDKKLLIIDGAGHGQTQDAQPLSYFTAIRELLEKTIE